MPRIERPSLRRISTLDTIEEASSDSLSRSSFGRTSLGRLSIGFSVNIPANCRPQRHESGHACIRMQPVARRRTSRFRQSLCAVPDSPPKPKRKRYSTYAAPDTKKRAQTHSKPPTKLQMAGPMAGPMANPMTSPMAGPVPPILSSPEHYVPSYARPTAASLAKATRVSRNRQ